MTSKHTTGLEQFELFKGCTTHEFDRIRSLSTSAYIPSDTQLTRQGSTGRQFVIILSGQVSIQHDGTLIALAGPGEIIGEIALLERDEVQRTARTTTPCELLVFSATEFSTMMTEMPNVASRVQRIAIHHLLEDENVTSKQPH